ncbi:hypothetical protein ES708_20333 [subsurface metagenome]
MRLLLNNLKEKFRKNSLNSQKACCYDNTKLNLFQQNRYYWRYFRKAYCYHYQINIFHKNCYRRYFPKGCCYYYCINLFRPHRYYWRYFPKGCCYYYILNLFHEYCYLNMCYLLFYRYRHILTQYPNKNRNYLMNNFE